MAGYAHGGGFSVDAGVRIEVAEARRDGAPAALRRPAHHLPWTGASSAVLIG
ncbi:MAG: hypothetical protein LH632_22620 [Rhodoferax sp.]|nr:hypothetical protein [Rhodoferax sp.]